MALAQKNFERIQMSSILVERVIALLRPHSLDGSIAYLKNFEDQPSRYLDNREEARRVIADGGGVEFYKWDVSDANGVRKSFRLDSGAVDLSILDSSSMFSVEFRATGPGPSASVSLNRWVVSPNPGPLSLTIQTDDRFIDDLLEAVTQIIEEHHIPVPPVERPPFKVFIGHGGDPQWKYLRATLENMHDIRAEAFESAERVGYHTLVVVDQMVRSSSVAVVIMTGEDVMPDESLRARENVIHEIGFCQGALGIDRTIVVMEEGISEPSNITGLTQIRFSRGALIDVQGRIIEAIRQRQQAHAFEVAP